MAEFFKLLNSQKQELTNLSGTWTVYCSENEQATISNSVLIQQSEFTTDEVGNVVGPIVELEDGRGGTVQYTGILVDDSYNDAFILIETDEYKRTIEKLNLASKGELKGIPSDKLLVYGTRSEFSFDIKLLNESEYIQEKAQQIRQKIENRIDVVVEAPAPPSGPNPMPI